MIPRCSADIQAIIAEIDALLARAHLAPGEILEYDESRDWTSGERSTLATTGLPPSTDSQDQEAGTQQSPRKS